jgi:hypothetical protein
MPKREFIIKLEASLGQEKRIVFLGYGRNQWVTEYPDARKFHSIREAKATLRQIEVSGIGKLDIFRGFQKPFINTFIFIKAFIIIIEHYGYETETVVTQTCYYCKE